MQPQTRWSGLTDLMKTLTSSVQLPVYLEISGTDLQTGTPEVLHDLTVWAPETVVVQVPDACTETEWAAIQKQWMHFICHGWQSSLCRQQHKHRQKELPSLQNRKKKTL